MFAPPWRSHKLSVFAWHPADAAAQTPGPPASSRGARPARDATPERAAQPRQPVTLLSAGTHAVAMPQLGYGVHQIPAHRCREATLHALRTGYRAIDSTSVDDNEPAVGAALRTTDVPRNEIFLTTKVCNDRHGYDQTLAAFEASSKRLGQGAVDLLLIHGPCPQQERYVDSWRAVLRLRDEGRIRAAGVTNFGIRHLQRLIDETGEAPAVNQVELHPYLTRTQLRAFHAEHGIATQAWGPLARGGRLLRDPVVVAIAREHARTPAQVVLRWHLQHGNAAIPKSADPARATQNFAIFDFELTPDQVAALDALDRGELTGAAPATTT
ncbi:2,5-diketo-D-gluconate reductase A [Kineosphaera limosa]|nr:aldo/keto reductase [Kineosphaera limosa]NYE01852.1 2,5-diketo-D-gluconate reductase A [Kineosphaera limosa]